MPIGFIWGIKISSNLTIQELIGIATTDGPSIPTLADDKSNVVDFLREYRVTDGSTLVPNYKVYYDYCRVWQPESRNKLSKIGFLRKFSIVFRSTRTKDARYYYLDAEAFDMSKEALHEAKRFDERYRRRIAKKSKQTKQSKVSSTTEKIQSENETGLY